MTEQEKTDLIGTINALANNVVNSGGDVDDLRRYLIEAIKK